MRLSRFLAFGSLSFIFPQLLSATSIHIVVSGMVCAFCAQGIEKKFRSEDVVQDVKVDLDQKKVDLQLKDGKDLADKRIIQVVTESGFNVKTIERK